MVRTSWEHSRMHIQWWGTGPEKHHSTLNYLSEKQDSRDTCPSRGITGIEPFVARTALWDLRFMQLMLSGYMQDTCCLCMSAVSARRLGFFISKNVGRAARPHLGRCGLSRQEGAEVSERKRPFAHLKQTGRDPAPSATPGRHREALRSTGCEVSLNKHGQLQHKAERQRQVEISTARRSAAQVTWPIATPISTFLTNNVWPGGGWDLPVCFFIFVMSRCHSWSRNCFKQTAERWPLVLGTEVQKENSKEAALSCFWVLLHSLCNSLVRFTHYSLR